MTRLMPLALIVLAVAPAPAGAAVADRVLRASVTPGGGDPDGPSRRPDLSSSGRLVVFESTAANLTADPNGAVADVFARDLVTGTTMLVSDAPGGANGPSRAATVASGGGTVVFESDASNLGPADANGVTDIYARSGGGPVRRVSLTSTGGEPDGRSYEADVSADGRLVVFTSQAGNLVPGDGNGVEDVFVRDLVAGTTRRVSAPRAGGDANGRSSAPAISPDGRFVSFQSAASNLVAGDRNGVADVFLADLDEGGIVRVSVATSGREQNAAVAPPFTIISDVSRGGRYVAFDSDATNLVRGDTNQDTDVFVRDVFTQTTERVSTTALGYQADNDSYYPALSPDGRYVGFSSYAGNIYPHDRAGEDVFLHDRTLHSTTLLTAHETGTARGTETATQLLRRPALALGGKRVAFTSTSDLTAGDGNGLEDVFVRSTRAPRTRFVRAPKRSSTNRRPRVVLGADDPAATVFACRIDGGQPRICPRSFRMPRLAPGRHRIKARAGGPGMLFDATPVRRIFRVR